MNELLQIGSQFGIAGMVIAYFVWRDKQRAVADAEEKKATISRIQATEDWIRDHFMQALESNTAAFREVAHSLRRCKVNAKDIESEETHTHA